MQLDLTSEELGVLERILGRSLGELREEVYLSEPGDYDARLRGRESILTLLLDRVQAATAATPLAG